MSEAQQGGNSNLQKQDLSQLVSEIVVETLILM